MSTAYSEFAEFEANRSVPETVSVPDPLEYVPCCRKKTPATVMVFPAEMLNTHPAGTTSVKFEAKVILSVTVHVPGAKDNAQFFVPRVEVARFMVANVMFEVSPDPNTDRTSIISPTFKPEVVPPDELTLEVASVPS